MDTPPLRRQGPSVVHVRHRLGQMPSRQQRGFLRGGVAQDQNRPPDASLSQGDPLSQAGYGKGPDARSLQGAGRHRSPVAVGLRLYHRHQLRLRSQCVPQHLGVVPEGCQIHLPPGPGGGAGLLLNPQ